MPSENEKSPYHADQLGYEDQFGKLIADSTKSLADLPSYNPYSPERYRVHYDSGTTGSYSRRFIQYGDTANFRDESDIFVLAPDQGDTIKIQTAEAFPYIVQYVIVPSFSFGVNQPLSGSDKLTIAYGDADLNNDMANADGWILEFEANGKTNSVYFSEYRNGSIESNDGKRKEANLERAITNFIRLATPLNWYNVGSAELVETYTESGKQFNDTLSKISVDSGRGTTRSARQIQLSLRNDSGSLEANVGSMAVVLLGDSTPFARAKSIIDTASITVTDVWEPIWAFNIPADPPDRETQLSNLQALNYSVNAGVQLQLQAFDAAKVSFSGNDSFSTPPELSSTSTSAETRSDVSEMADSTGTRQTSTTNPGGWQVGDDYLTKGNKGAQTFNTSPGKEDIIRPMFDEDYQVLMGKSSSTGDITFKLNFTQRF